MSRVVRNIRFVVPLPAPKHLCSKRRDQKCKTLWGGYADDPGTDGARHWAKWRGDRAEATGQRARPKADGESCLAFPCPRAAAGSCLPILEGKTRGI